MCLFVHLYFSFHSFASPCCSNERSRSNIFSGATIHNKCQHQNNTARETHLPLFLPKTKKMVPLSRVAKDYRLCAVWASIKTPEMHGFLEAFGYSLKSSCDRQTEAEVHVGCGSVALEVISAPTTNNLYLQSQIQHIYCIRFSRKYLMPRANEPQCSGNSHEKLLQLHEPILHSQLAVWLPTLPSTIL